MSKEELLSDGDTSTEEDEREPVDTIEKLEAVVGEVMELADKGVIRTIVYTVIGNALKLDPVWLVVVGPPSGGKSELLQATYGMPSHIYPISSLTSKTFASGMVGAGDASLLKVIKDKTMVMKDFTTFTEGNQDELKSILAQMREIYDGRFDKMFGTGKKVNWEGHVGCLAAITGTGVMSIQAHSSMGERFIFYKIKQPNRKKAQERASANREGNMMELRAKMADAFTEFMQPILDKTDDLVDADKHIIVEPDFKKEIMELANFATDVRSSIGLDWKTKEITHIPDKEMPMRFQGQLYTLAAAAMFTNDTDKLAKRDKNLIRQIAFGSIPVERLEIMKILTEYHRANTPAIATKISYPSGTTRRWLNELVGLKILKRLSIKGKASDYWEMEQKYKDTMAHYFEIEQGGKDKILEGEEDTGEEVPDEAYMPEMGEYLTEEQEAHEEGVNRVFDDM